MTETQAAPMNGTFPAQHAYHDSYNPAHAAMTNAATFQPTQSSTPSNVPQAGDMKSGLSKDEVGWYFVEQYYTNMSRCPEKLHHFYSRRSQFVFGNEAETVPVAVGQKDINEKIKQLDFQECKVRVLNVDSQASFDNILVSVIGEISNKSEPSRKFVQTFVLAEQPNGYYVLNDIFRYLTEDEEISNEEPAPAVEQQEAPQAPAELAAPAEAAPAPVDAKVDTESAAHKVDEKLEEEAQPNGEAAPSAATQQTNGETAAEKTTEAPAPAAETEPAQPEYPPSPEPTPVPAEPKEPAAPKEEAPAPAPARAVPKTWANIASKPGATVPAASAAPAAAPAKASAAPSSTQAAAPAAAPSQPAAAAAAAAPVESKPASTDNSGWQTAGPDHKKTQSRAGEEPNTLAYIKNVNEKVDASLLRDTLTSFGKLKYFDVSRGKNCAFVEFAEPAGYAAAVAANPHQIGSEQITVEERRPRGNAYGGNAGFGHGRGGAGRGRGDRAGSQGRGGFQRDGRGGFAPRGRGGNVGAKGRNQAQAA